MRKSSRSPARRRTYAAHKSVQPRAAIATRDAPPLVRLQAHWTLQAHPRYLAAATFLWPQ